MKYLWHIGLTAIAEFDSMMDAIQTLEYAPVDDQGRLRVIFGEREIWVKKEDIDISSEEVFNNL